MGVLLRTTVIFFVHAFKSVVAIYNMLPMYKIIGQSIFSPDATNIYTHHKSSSNCLLTSESDYEWWIHRVWEIT